MLPTEELISKTKVILPKRRLDLLTRPRLLEILYERLERKLIIISAAAGYGKTSLLIDLAYHSELPFCWLALEPLDQDPQRFIAGLITSIRERFPDFGKRSRSLLNGMTSLDNDMERLLVMLVNEIYDDIHEHFVLVLDDFHVLDEAKPILYFVNRFIQLVGENCHLVLASRTLPELQDIPLLVAREDVGGLDFSDLAFRPDEIQALLAQNRQIVLTSKEAKELVDATEGWITGLQFADLGRVAAQEGARPFVSAGRVGVTVFDYLGQQVLEQQPAELQTFMLRSSMLDEFDVGLCEAVLGPLYDERPDWPRLIETITQKNLFTQPVGPKGQWLRYHHLFRDYLQSRFRSERPDEVEPLLKRLAQCQEDSGQWEKAYQTYSELGNIEALAALVERAGIPMYQHAMITLENWLNTLPPSMVAARPGLLSLRGNIETQKGNSGESLRLFNQAIEIYRERAQQDGLTLTLVRRAVTYRLLGKYDEALRDADDVLKACEAGDDRQWVLADALRIQGLCLFRLGHTREALTYFQKALDVYMSIRDEESIPLMLMETGVAYSALGNHAEAKASYQKALKFWKESGNLTSQAVLLNNYAVLLQELGEYEDAAAAFEEGLLCARQSGYRRMEALILLGIGDLYSEIGDLDMAMQNYQQASDLIEELGEPFQKNYLSLVTINLRLLEGNTGEARRLIEAAAASIQGGPSLFERGRLELLQARLELQEGKPQKALTALRDAKQLFALDGREMESIWTSVWLAAAECAAGEQAAAREEIRAVVPSANHVKHAAIIAARQAAQWLGGLRKDPEVRLQLRGLFDKADRLENALPAVRRQLRRLAHTIEVPTPSLIIRAFGAGQVWVNGHAVTAKEWQTHSVRELFFFFLSASRPLSREQVGAALWPGTEEPAKFRMRFKNEMYRLRRAVGQETILFDGETYRFDASGDHEYDVEAFQAYLRKAKAALQPREQMSYYERAINLVQGRYLEDISASWVIAEQERLHQAFLSGVLSLAELYRSEGLIPKAVEICQRALSLDKTAETVYRALMEIFAHLGDKASVVHVYRTCEQTLQETLQVAPSEETSQLYQRLTA